MFARRLQNQQRFTEQLLEAFDAGVQPLGCAAIVEACHMGAEEREIRTTAAALGCFHEKPAIFMQVWHSSKLGGGSLCNPPSCLYSDKPDIR